MWLEGLKPKTEIYIGMKLKNIIIEFWLKTNLSIFLISVFFLLCIFPTLSFIPYALKGKTHSLRTMSSHFISQPSSIELPIYSCNKITRMFISNSHDNPKRRYWKCPTFHLQFTWVSKGSASRETRCCEPIITLEAVNIWSIKCWGIAAWPPFPLLFTSKKPLYANIGTNLDSISLIGNFRSICNSKIAKTFSNPSISFDFNCLLLTTQAPTS